MKQDEIEVDGTYFNFPASWRVEKFDDWKRYKTASNFGVKGCDVVAFDGEDLWVIEVKDYTYPGAKAPADLPDAVGLKAVGTLGVLFVLARSESDSRSRDFACNSAQAGRIHLALHVDYKDGGRKRRHVEPLLMSMKQDLQRVRSALNIHRCYVTSTLAPSESTPWEARRNPRMRAEHADR